MNCLHSLYRALPLWQPAAPIGAPVVNPWLQTTDNFAPSPGLGQLLASEDLALGWLMMALAGGAPPTPNFSASDWAAPKADHVPEGRVDGPVSDLGLKARQFSGSRQGGWGGWCLSWVRNAVEWASGKGERGIPLLNAGSAEEARQKAARAGILRQGNPPPGAVIFFKPGTHGMNSRYGHIAIANADGESFRGSSSSLGGNEVGDLRYPRGAKDDVYWTMPEWLVNPAKARQSA